MLEDTNQSPYYTYKLSYNQFLAALKKTNPALKVFPYWFQKIFKFFCKTRFVKLYDSHLVSLPTSHKVSRQFICSQAVMYNFFDLTFLYKFSWTLPRENL